MGLTKEQIYGLIDKLDDYVSKDKQAKIVSGIRRLEPPIDEDEDFFEIGMARSHGFLEEDSLNLTEAGRMELLRIVFRKELGIEEEEIEEEE